jgi:hypothetical protein
MGDNRKIAAADYFFLLFYIKTRPLPLTHELRDCH